MQSGLLKGVLKFLKGKGMNILEQITEVFSSDRPQNSEYLRGWNHRIHNRKQDFNCAAVEYHEGYEDAHEALKRGENITRIGLAARASQ